jgi:hypothetical protein
MPHSEWNRALGSGIDAPLGPESAWGLPRSTYYLALERRTRPQTPGKRGPRRISDEALVAEIRQVIDTAVFNGEG